MAYKNGFRLWDEEFDKEFFTPEEIAESDARVAVITAMIKARQNEGLSQRQLAEMAGIKQPQLARMERFDANPRVDTLIKVLSSLGKKLVVVDMDEPAKQSV